MERIMCRHEGEVANAPLLNHLIDCLSNSHGITLDAEKVKHEIVF